MAFACRKPSFHEELGLVLRSKIDVVKHRKPQNPREKSIFHAKHPLCNPSEETERPHHHDFLRREFIIIRPLAIFLTVYSISDHCVTVKEKTV